MKIILIVATKCKIFTPKCTEFDFGLLGNFQRSPDPLAGEEWTGFPSPHWSHRAREAAKYVLIFTVPQNAHKCVPRSFIAQLELPGPCLYSAVRDH